MNLRNPAVRVSDHRTPPRMKAIRCARQLRLPFRARFWRFCLVGGAGFLVDVGTLYATMTVAGLGPVAARVPAFLFAATFTWGANRIFTFGPSGRHTVIEWLLFLIANSLGSAANFLGYLLALSALRSTATLGPAIAVACGSVAGLIFNYAVSQSYVFARGRGV